VPLHISVLRGNRTDTRTLRGLLAMLRRRFGLAEAVFVFDGGMGSRVNLEPEAADAGRVLGHDKNLLEVEDAFRELKSCLEVRPVFHRRPDRVVNHVRVCFLAYWISARLGVAWKARGERGEVPRILRRLQGIRLGRFRVAGTGLGDRLATTRIPPDLNRSLSGLDLLRLFRSPPRWASEAAA